MTTAWLTATEMRAWRNFMESTGLLMNALEADLQSHDLTLGDYEVLVRLSDAPDRSMRMCDLAGVLQLSPSGLTRRLDGMVRSGFVERVACDDDRRVMHAHLTDVGLTKLEAAAPDHVHSVRTHLLGPLSPSQIEHIGDIFSVVRERLLEQSAS